MPGSEGGDRVHNSFDQEKFSNQHPQGLDGNGLGSNGFHWPGNQRHEASDQGRGNLDRQSSLVQSSPFLQSPQRSAFTVSPHPTQAHHCSQNGYIHNHQLSQAKRDETDYVGMSRVSNQHNPFSRGFLNSGAQYRNVTDQHQDVRLETTESPINFDFLGSQQQMNTQQHGMLQPSPGQHSGLNERQLLQQQAMLRNTYDVQRQKQLQNQDIRHMNSVNSLSSKQQIHMGQSSSTNSSFQDGSNYALMPQHGAGNLNWLQGVVSPVMQGNSNGISFSTEQSAPPHIFGFSPQSVDHSLYGFPISNTRGSSSHHPHSIEKHMPLSQQVPSESNPLPGNQYDIQLGQVNAQDSEFGSRFGVQNNNNPTDATSHVSYPGTTIGNISQVESQQRKPSIEFLGIQSMPSPSMNSKENTLSQAVILQDATPLDPTEEQFLFGSDNNIWVAFGKSSNSKIDDYGVSEFQNAFPSMLSGSWSALMQSALAETCSGDTSNQKELSGLNLCAKPAAAGHEPLAYRSSDKQRTSVTNGNLHTEYLLDTNHYTSLEKSGANSHIMQGFPLSSLSHSSNGNERFHLNSASKSNQQISVDPNRFDHSNLKCHSEDNQSNSKSVCHSTAAPNLKGPLGDTSGNRLKDTFMSGHCNLNVAGGRQQDSDQVAGNSPGLAKYQHNSSGQGLKNFTQNDKGKGSYSHADVQKICERSSAALSMSHLANKTIQSSHNMAEFLNKARQTRENSAEASRNSSEPSMLSERPATESPETSMSNLQQSQFLGSQTHGLQLGPPHQRFLTQIHQSSSQAPRFFGVNSGQFALHHPSVASQAELHDPRFGVLGQSGHPISLHGVQENSSDFISSGTPHLGNQLRNKQSYEEHTNSNSGMPAGTVISPLDRIDNMLAKASIMQSSVRAEFNSTGSNRNPAPLPSSSSIADENIQPNIRPRHVGLLSSWTSIPHQHSVSQPDGFTSESQMKTFVAPNKKDELNTSMAGNYLPGSGALPVISSCKSRVPDETSLELKAADVPGKDGFPFSDTVTQANREIIGNSVKSDAKLQNSYSLLHQLHVMRSTEVDPNNRESKRPRVQSSSSDTQQLPSRFGQYHSSYSPSNTEIVSSNLAASGDSKLGKYTSVTSTNQGNYLPLQQGSAPFQNAPNNNTGSPAVTSMPLTQINPQMAPSWFGRYGSFNMEQHVPASVWKSSFSRPLLVQTPENSSASFVVQSHVQQIPIPFVGQVGDPTHHSDPENIVIEQSTSPKLTSLTSPNLVSVMPHKLTTATIEPIPWYKEVTQHGLRDLPNIRASEVKWANATKRIPEVIVEVELADNRIVNCKRRLVLTTQLIQQLLDPPPASVMSSDAYMDYEIVVYFTSRLSSGSACSLSGSQNHCISFNHDSTMTFKKVLEQGDALLSKVANDFHVRASKLENILASLEKQMSIQDLRVEWQDIEKISVINRFAKFHGRGQADGPAIINSAVNLQSHGPQRYVTVLPAPRNLPDTVQCLSL